MAKRTANITYRHLEQVSPQQILIDSIKRSHRDLGVQIAELEAALYKQTSQHPGNGKLLIENFGENIKRRQ